jgi:hypothetical protein
MKILRSIYALSLLGCLLLCGTAAAQPVTYQYVGSHYLNPTGVFTTSMSINGSFTTANPLPPNTSADIGPAGDGRAIAWSFNDGVSTFTQANSAELYGNAGNFYIATDANGNVSSYNIGLASPLPPHTTSTLMNFFYLNHGNQVQALYQSQCAIVTVNLCTFLPFGGAGTVADNTEAGHFLPTNLPIPALGAAGVIALGTMIAAAALLFLRKRTGFGA